MTYLKFKTKRENVLLNTFTKGYCYYFAIILTHRFSGHILYDKSEGHFVTKINRYIYDIRGDVTEIYKNKNLLNEKQWKNDKEIVYGCIEKYVK